MNVELSKRAAKLLRSLDKPTQVRIVEGIRKIPDGDIKPLQGHEGRYRLRIGKYRIIYIFSASDVLYVFDIGSRGDIYK